MDLCIDIGNKRIKLGLFSDRALVDQAVFLQSEGNKVLDWLKTKPKLDKAILSNVGQAPEGLHEWLDKNEIRLIKLDDNPALPFTSQYTTPGTLGHDRVASAAGAMAWKPGQDILVIDAGSAITIDFIDASGNYQGGIISPGLAMRYKALTDYTARLPLVSPGNTRGLAGNDTISSISLGVQNGIIFEIDRYIEEYREKYPNIFIIMTGGDADFFEKSLKNRIFVNQNLLLEGLNRILEYNVTIQ